MAKTKKSTKRFVQNKLKGVLERRKQYKKKKELYGGGKPKGKKIPEHYKQKEEEDNTENLITEEDEDLWDEIENGEDNEVEDEEEEEDDDEMEEEELEEEDNEEEEEEEDINEIEEHKKQLEELKEKDPEFYKFLQENDKELLAFGNDEGNEEEEEVEEAPETEMDEEEEEDIPKAKQLTKFMIINWQKQIVEKNSLKSTRKMILALRAAAAIDEEYAEGKEFGFAIDNISIFNKLVLTAVKYITPVFNYHLNYTEDSKQLPSQSKKWSKVQPLVKHYLQNIIRLLKQLTDQKILYFVCKNSQAAVKYFACFPKLSKEYLKLMLNFWAVSEEKIKIVSFLNIRSLSLCSSQLMNISLKGIYLAFVRNCKATSIHTWTIINFMMNCVVELYGLDFVASYQTAFVYIRQLAIQLRNAIILKKKESFRIVYNWQYVHCLRLWSRLVTTYCDYTTGTDETENLLFSLIYPITQITIGTICLVPTSRFFPLRFHCIRALLEIHEKTRTYIPVAPYLFEVLNSSEIQQKAKASTLKPFDFRFNIKANKSYLHTRVYQDGLAEETLSLLLHFYAQSSNSIAFPELVIPAQIQLKRFIKKSKNIKVNKQVQQLLEKINQTSAFIESQRSSVDFSPSEKEKVMAFERAINPKETPIGKYFNSIKKIQERKEQDAANMNEAKGVPNKTNNNKNSKKNKNKKQAKEERKQEIEEDESEYEEVDNEVNDSDFDEMDEDNDMDIVEDFVLSDDE
ncbi:Noc2-domain-containing protein [Neocallimastix lanati (nom. inval.)]|nr:Noc2-domain-containing protein [Neocallimastix sp. JGI-2020a]